MALAVLSPDVLKMWEPKGVGNDPPSLTPKNVTLCTEGRKDVLVIPVYTNTKVAEVKGLLEQRFGIDPSSVRFIYKQGCMFRENLDCEEVARFVTVRGMRKFARDKAVYPYPHVVIGAGHIGLKCGMTWVMEGTTNFVIIDRRDRVGGTSWLEQANVTSRLQTEAGVYHLEYHESNGWPADCRTNPWPSRDQLLERFHKVSEEFGILPHCRLNTNVSKLSVVGKEYKSQHYELTIESQGMTQTMQAASVALFPGNLTLPKKVVYPGEDSFDGDIVYGISNLFDYSKVNGQQVSIIGSGAFAVENIRSCVEFKAHKVFMICRRKTISLPRVVSWLANQSVNFISAALTLEAMAPMYDLINVDQWSYYSVIANQSRTSVQIRQKSRFGIGDVYFLGMYYGFVEHIVDDVKRLSHHRIHLNSGRQIENVPIMLKLLGFNGDFENDKLMKLKELYGWWAQKDHRRYIVAEPLGVDANNFAGTSFSPGAISWAETHVHLLNYPKDWDAVAESGAMPTHEADEENGRPAYVVEARHGAMTQLPLNSLIPALGERAAVSGAIKHQRMWQMHPMDDYLECCRREWDAWSKIIQELGYGGPEKPHPEYPYNKHNVGTYLEKEHEAYRQTEKRWSGA